MDLYTELNGEKRCVTVSTEATVRDAKLAVAETWDLHEGFFTCRTDTASELAESQDDEFLSRMLSCGDEILHVTRAEGPEDALRELRERFKVSHTPHHELHRLITTQCAGTRTIESEDLRLERINLCFEAIAPAELEAKGPDLIAAACEYNCEIIVVKLLEHGVGCNGVNTKDFTPLELCALSGNQRLLLHLYDSGADVDRRNMSRWTAWMHAFRSDKLVAAEFLRERSARGLRRRLWEHIQLNFAVFANISVFLLLPIYWWAFTTSALFSYRNPHNTWLGLACSSVCYTVRLVAPNAVMLTSGWALLRWLDSLGSCK